MKEKYGHGWQANRCTFVSLGIITIDKFAINGAMSVIIPILPISVANPYVWTQSISNFEITTIPCTQFHSPFYFQCFRNLRIAKEFV